MRIIQNILVSRTEMFQCLCKVSFICRDHAFKWSELSQPTLALLMKRWSKRSYLEQKKAESYQRLMDRVSLRSTFHFKDLEKNLRNVREKKNIKNIKKQPSEATSAYSATVIISPLCLSLCLIDWCEYLTMHADH